MNLLRRLPFLGKLADGRNWRLNDLGFGTQ
jgi:hypothetical protein